VWAADVGPAAEGPPGTIGTRGISTVDGELLLADVQPAGGRRMPWAAFLRGRKEILGRVVLPAP